MALLEVRGLDAFYGAFQALFRVDLQIAAGEVVALVGANGAGKSTLLKSICGLLPARRDAIVFDGAPIGGLPAGSIVRRGVAMVPEGRRLFPSLSVEENLLVGGHTKRAGPWNLESVYRLFPVVRDKRARSGAELSGGEQQVVAIGRALMSNPRLLLCDEISLGLSPRLVKDLYQALPGIRAGGLTVVIVEQDVTLAQQVSDRLYCLQEGRVSLAGSSRELTRDQISRSYFGL